MPPKRKNARITKSNKQEVTEEEDEEQQSSKRIKQKEQETKVNNNNNNNNNNTTTSSASSSSFWNVCRSRRSIVRGPHAATTANAGGGSYQQVAAIDVNIKLDLLASTNLDSSVRLFKFSTGELLWHKHFIHHLRVIIQLVGAKQDLLFVFGGGSADPFIGVIDTNRIIQQRQQSLQTLQASTTPTTTTIGEDEFVWMQKLSSLSGNTTLEADVDELKGRAVVANSSTGENWVFDLLEKGNVISKFSGCFSMPKLEDKILIGMCHPASTSLPSTSVTTTSSSPSSSMTIERKNGEVVIGAWDIIAGTSKWTTIVGDPHQGEGAIAMTRTVIKLKNERVVIAAPFTSIWVLDAKSGNKMHKFELPVHSMGPIYYFVNSMSFDGERLLCRFGQDKVLLWNNISSSTPTCFRYESVDQSYDNQSTYVNDKFAIWVSYRIVKVHDVSNGKELASFPDLNKPGPSKYFTSHFGCLCAAEDGKLLLLGCFDDLIRVYDFRDDAQGYKEEDRVWARLKKSHPWWPAKVVTPPKEETNNESNQVYVYFFGKRVNGWVQDEPEFLVPYGELPTIHYGNNPPKDAKVKKQFREALTESPQEHYVDISGGRSLFVAPVLMAAVVRKIGWQPTEKMIAKHFRWTKNCSHLDSIPYGLCPQYLCSL